jgi:quinol-cytochrome oxidoreductase complex cytochrome b subunit
LIAGVAVAHLAVLHFVSSSNPLGCESTVDKIPMSPYFLVKDLVNFFLLLFVAGSFLFFAPNYLGHPDNYIPADPMVTPAHIVPE